MSETKTTARFVQSGSDVGDTEQNRVAGFGDDATAAFSAEFMNTATYAQIEAYIWEDAK